MRIDFSKFGNIKDHLITIGVMLLALLMMIARQDGAFQNARVASMNVISVLEAPLSNVRIYRTALKTNAELERQNILLQDEISRLRSMREENVILRELLALKDTTTYPLVPVRVVSKTLSGVNNSIIINAGSRHGVEVGMPVINAEGLVGQVVLTGERNATVLPIINQQFRVSGMIEGSRALGILAWEGTGGDELVLRYVPITIPVSKGMRVFTSGLSSQFPPGIPIGEIIRFEPEPGKDTQLIYVRAYSSLYRLAEAHVMLFRADEEVLNLEQTWNRAQR